MPMRTTLRISLGERPWWWAMARSWERISAAVRFRPKPKAPVAQKVHPAGQPTMLERQTVLRFR
jgi:hypothetical protein